MGAIVATITTETTEGIQVGLPILVTLGTVDLGANLPDPTGQDGSFLGTDGSTWAPARSFTSPDGKSTVTTYDGYAFVDVQDGDLYSSASADSTGAEVYATDGTATAQVRANIDGTVEINATGAATLNG